MSAGNAEANDPPLVAPLPDVRQEPGLGHVACPHCAYEFESMVLEAAITEGIERAAPPQIAEGRDELERDALRYRWLRSQMHAGGRVDMYILASAAGTTGGDWGAAPQIKTAAHLDCAVDSAQKTKP